MTAAGVCENTTVSTTITDATVIGVLMMMIVDVDADDVMVTVMAVMAVMTKQFVMKSKWCKSQQCRQM